MCSSFTVIFGQKDVLMQRVQFLIISHTFHKGKPQTRELSWWLLHTVLRIAHRSLPVHCQSNRPQTFVPSHHHPPSSSCSVVLYREQCRVQAATRSTLTLAAANNLLNLKPEKYAVGWDTHISFMSQVYTALSRGRMCIYSLLMLSLSVCSVFCWNTVQSFPWSNRIPDAPCEFARKVMSEVDYVLFSHTVNSHCM